MYRPLVTVLMPVYNGAEYLADAIESVLAQTYGHFELLVIDDCSTDASREVVRSFNDIRIRHVLNSCNLGLSATLNKGIELARGKYIMRMDQDDLSLSGRMSAQVAYLEEHPSVGLCGASVKVFGLREETHPATTDPVFLADMSLFSSPVQHSACIFRTEVFDDPELRYRSEFDGAEDFDLFGRIVRRWGVANLPEVLVRYRVHGDQMSFSDEESALVDVRSANQLRQRARIRRARLRELLCQRDVIDPALEDVFFEDAPLESYEQMVLFDTLIDECIECNSKLKLYSHGMFRYQRKKILGRFLDTQPPSLATFKLYWRWRHKMPYKPKREKLSYLVANLLGR